MSLQIIFGLVTVILETVKSVHHNILEPTVASLNVLVYHKTKIWKPWGAGEDIYFIYIGKKKKWRVKLVDLLLSLFKKLKKFHKIFLLKKKKKQKTKFHKRKKKTLKEFKAINLAKLFSPPVLES